MRHPWLASLGTILALGCTRAPETVTVIELWAAGREGEIVSSLTRDFEAEHPHLRVKVQQLPWSGAHEKLLTAVVGDSVPDVAQLGNTWIAEFATIGALEPLTERIERSKLDARDYFPGIWETNRFQGELYGVPWYVDTRLLFYRRDLLERAGFTQPPKSWSELLEVSSALERAAPPGGSALFLPLNEPEALLAFGLQQPEPLLRDGNRFGNFRSAGFQRALSFYVELFSRGLAPKAGSAEIGNLWEEFGRGTFAIYISGPWQLGELERRLPPALAESWTTAPLPGPDGPGASLAGGSSLVVFRGSPRKSAAFELVEYLSRPEVQRRFYALSGDLPARRSSYADPALERDPHLHAFREQLERVKPLPRVPEWERIAREVAIFGERAARALLPVESAAAALDQRVDAILEKRRWVLAREAKP